MSESENVLDVLVADLYRRAAQEKPVLNVSLQIIDSPSLACEIIKNPHIFLKNYSFLEKLSHGRFSANGIEWEKRARLTQSFYHQTTHSLSDEKIEAIYSHRLLANDLHCHNSFAVALIDSAIDVISLSYGIAHSIPWPHDIVETMGALLREEQIVSCVYPASERCAPNAALMNDYMKLASLWKADPHIDPFLNRLNIAAQDIPGFDATGELTQNLYAASETTASGILWALEVIGRNSQIQDVLRNTGDEAMLDLFCNEVLRLYPPVPFVTRVVAKTCSYEGVRFYEGQEIIISIVGINCNRYFWKDALSFQFPRDEFVKSTYQNIAYIPFLSGPRVCGGMKLAKRELKIALKLILHQFRVKEISVPLSITYGLTSRPATTIDDYLERITN